MLKSPENTTLPEGPVSEMKFEFTGNMNRYVWTINNKTVSETDKILIKQGENIRIIMYNNSMMRHPMHLHGHFFRVLNGQGEYSPLKTVLDMMPMETDTIEFHASEKGGDWYFHCHILYHMMAGMGRMFSYAIPIRAFINLIMSKISGRSIMTIKDFSRLPKLGWKAMAAMVKLLLVIRGGLCKQNGDWEGTKKSGYESEAHIGRYTSPNQWLLPYVGFDWRSRKYDVGEAEKKKWKGIFLARQIQKMKGRLYVLGFNTPCRCS